MRRPSFCWSREPKPCNTARAQGTSLHVCAKLRFPLQSRVYKVWDLLAKRFAIKKHPLAMISSTMSARGLFENTPAKWHIGAVAALPLTCNGPSVGVLMVYLREAGSLDEQTIAVLVRMAANISFAFGNFEHERKRRDTEQAMERVSRMFVALGATNEAIIRAKSRAQLFEMVCEAAVDGAKFASTTIALAEAGSVLLRVVASTGPGAAEMKISKFAIAEIAFRRTWLDRGSIPHENGLHQQ